MRIWALVLTIFVALLSTKESNAVDGQEWINYKMRFNKIYPNPQIESQRRNIFLSNLDFINRFNSKPNRSFSLGVNQFADLTNAEFNQIYNRLRPPRRLGRAV